MRLGPQYGVTGTGLAKICDRLNVPYPPAGYWLRVNAGRSPEKAILPPAREGIPDDVTISPTPERSKDELEAEANFAEALEKFKTVEVCENLRGQHPAVAALIAEHDRDFREAKREQRRWGDTSSRVGALTELDHRRHRILNTFLKEAGKVGFSVITAGSLQKGKNRVDFSLEEYRRQFRRPLKPEERSTFNPDQKWTQEKAATGELRFKFLTGLRPGTQSLWSDTLDIPLENRIKDILATLSIAVPYLEQKRVDAEEKERIRIDAERKRQQETARRRTDNNRWRRVLEFSERCNTVNKVRSLIAEIEARATMGDDPLAGGRSRDEWLAWLKQRLTVYDPLEAGVDAIWSNLGGVTSWEYND
ncbi:MAG: hypothetical protein JWP25_7029 [Bradyrhizobium sp.]|nr:hypothetical protein [Bradyrhizobium sp.]